MQEINKIRATVWASLMCVVWPRPGMDQRERIKVRKVVGALFIAGYGLPLGALLAVAWWKESVVYGLIAGGLTLAIGVGMLVLIFRSGEKK